MREQGIHKASLWNEDGGKRSPLLPQLSHPQQHHPHTAGPLNLLPPALPHHQQLRHHLTGHPTALQLSPPGMQLPPAGRHLDQKAPIAQEMVHLTVGVAAGKVRSLLPNQETI
jgi:hypothetical protein